MAVFRRIIKTGNSLGVTIPSKVISDFDLHEGDVAEVYVNRSQNSITVHFSGHPRQMSLINKDKK